jgi:hypothetical protein
MPIALAHALYGLPPRSTPRRDRAAAMGGCQLRSGQTHPTPLVSPFEISELQYANLFS